MQFHEKHFLFYLFDFTSFFVDFRALHVRMYQVPTSDIHIFYFFLQHSCVKARVNGKEGVIVAGGSSDADPALTLVEFFDLSSSTWISLGRLREGRRFPGKKNCK